jgi:hypothetical protein
VSLDITGSWGHVYYQFIQLNIHSAGIYIPIYISASNIPESLFIRGILNDQIVYIKKKKKEKQKLSIFSFGA